MPRANDGSYSLPAGSLATTGDTILVSQHNPPLQDIAQSLTDSLDRNGTGGMLSDLNMNSNTVTNLAPGVNPTDAATMAQIGGAGGVPVGTIIDYAGSTAPDGWLFCNGQSLSRATYAALFEAIGTAFGSASGSTFNVPDMRGRVSAGKDGSGRLTSSTMTPNSTTVGAVGGAQTHTLTTAQLPSHAHSLAGGTTASSGAHTHAYERASNTGGGEGGGFSFFDNSFSDSTGSAGAHTHTLSGDTSPAGSGEAHLNVQPTIILNKLIKATN